MMSDFHARAELLMDQDRYDQALAMLLQHLAEHPEDAAAHAQRGYCLCMIDRKEEALQAVQQAVATAPDSWFVHYLKCLVELKAKQYEAGRQSALQSLALYPEHAPTHGVLCQSLFQLSRYKEALAAAETGLQYDPEDTTCLNFRALVLQSLGRRQEAEAAAEHLLSVNPDLPFTHANQGWTHLRANRPAAAQTAFLESLRLQPDFEWARQGLVSSIKAKNFAYRWLLQFMFFMSRLNPKVQFGLMIGAWLGINGLIRFGDEHPQWSGVVWPIIIAYMFFVYLSWAGDSLANFCLRFHPLGKHALTEDERRGANVLAVIFGAMVIAFVLWLTGVADVLLVALFLLGLTIPASRIYRAAAGRPRYTYIAITLALLILGIVPLAVIEFVDIPANSPLGRLFLFGINNFWYGVLATSFLTGAIDARR